MKAQQFERGRDVVVGRAHIQEQLVQDGLTGIGEPVPAAWKAAPTTAAR